jgi:hypothetical protein
LLDRPDHVVAVLVGRPQLAANGIDWECRYQIVGVGDETVREGSGVDSLQALQLVLTRAVPAWLDALHKEHPALRWEDAESGDFGWY